MSKKLTKDEQAIIAEALGMYGKEIKKLYKKADDLNLGEAEGLKQKAFDVSMLKASISGGDIEISEE